MEPLSEDALDLLVLILPLVLCVSAARLASQAFQGYQRYAAQERTRRPYSGPAPVRRARGYVPTRPFKISKPLKSVAKTVKKLSKRVKAKSPMIIASAMSS